MGIRPKNTVIKRIKYRGFFIEIIDTAWYSFRYEYKITPTSKAAKRLLRAQARKDKQYVPVIYDPSSTKYVSVSIQYAKYTVDDCWRNFVTGLLYC